MKSIGSIILFVVLVFSQPYRISAQQVKKVTFYKVDSLTNNITFCDSLLQKKFNAAKRELLNDSPQSLMLILDSVGNNGYSRVSGSELFKCVLFNNILLDTSNLSNFFIDGSVLNLLSDTIFFRQNNLKIADCSEFSLLNSKSFAVWNSSEVYPSKKELCFYDISSHPLKTCIYFSKGDMIYVKEEFLLFSFPISIYYFRR